MENDNFHCANCDKVTEHWTDIATPRCIICDPPEDVDKKKIENNSKKTQEQLDFERQSKYVFPILTVGIWALYSFVNMSNDVDGDFSRYYRPVEEFIFSHFLPIVMMSFLIAGIIFLIAAIFNKFKTAGISFFKILFWTSLIISIMALWGDIV
jgi:hypothetical protein